MQNCCHIWHIREKASNERLRSQHHRQTQKMRRIWRSWTYRVNFELQNEKKKEKNQFNASYQNEIVFRRKIANDSWNFQIRRHKIHKIEDVFSRIKNDRFKEKKIVANLKLKTSFESFSILMQIAKNNNMTNSRDKSSWTNVEIMNSKNMKKTLSHNLIKRSRFVNESSSKSKNVNALIVINTTIDFNFLWKIKSF